MAIHTEIDIEQALSLSEFERESITYCAKEDALLKLNNLNIYNEDLYDSDLDFEFELICRVTIKNKKKIKK